MTRTLPSRVDGYGCDQERCWHSQGGGFYGVLPSALYPVPGGLGEGRCVRLSWRAETVESAPHRRWMRCAVWIMGQGDADDPETGVESTLRVELPFRSRGLTLTRLKEAFPFLGDFHFRLKVRAGAG